MGNFVIYILPEKNVLLKKIHEWIEQNGIEIFHMRQYVIKNQKNPFIQPVNVY